jgi:3-deoxy-D-manno-octulosonate 8-phosphate phosphatase (KDO 8-P phosphatase)
MNLLAETESLRQRAAKVRLLAMDVDGVLSDGRIYFGPQGDALKAFDVRDGHGLRLLAYAGIRLAIITGRTSDIVTRRAADLGIDWVKQGRLDKRGAFRELLDESGLKADEVAYIGDDWPDLPLLAMAGLSATVEDAPPEVRERVHWVIPARGGRGAVRLLADLILKAQGKFEPMLQDAARHD